MGISVVFYFYTHNKKFYNNIQKSWSRFSYKNDVKLTEKRKTIIH